MIRLHFVVEGQTEQAFVRAVLTEHLGHFDVSCAARAVETSRDRARIFRGGLLDYGRAKKDLSRWLKQDAHADARFTTMFDLYALPTDFPGYEATKGLVDPLARVEALELAFADDVGDPRFVPYIQLHEFEALLFADVTVLGERFEGHGDALARLEAVVTSFSSPEHIDDGPNTAPSKRIISEIPDYEGAKVSAGPVLASKIGLPTLRSKCPHFDDWIGRLENLIKTQRAG